MMLSSGFRYFTNRINFHLTFRQILLNREAYFSSWRLQNSRTLPVLSCKNVISQDHASRNLLDQMVFSNGCHLECQRHLAKGKDIKRDKKSDRPKVILNDEDLEKVLQYEDFKLEIEVMIDEFKNELKLNYNVRLNSRLIENLEISYEGVNVALADIVNVVQKQQDLVLNFSATPNAVKSVMAAIADSGLNLNPQQDGNVIYLRLPKVTTEHRQAMVKSVKTAGQQLKDRVKDRNFHKKFYHKLDKKSLSQDLLNDVTANLNYYVKQKSAEIDEIVKQKVDSLMNN